MKVGLVMVVVNDLGGSGGTERLFSRLHEHLTLHGSAWNVRFITATQSLERLQAAGRLIPPHDVIALSLGEAPARGWLGVLWTTLRLLGATVGRGFDVIHVCLPTPTYLPYLALVGHLPRALRPALTTTVIDCTLAQSLTQLPPAGSYERQVLEAHQMYERWAPIDGVYSWYRAFVERSTRGVVRRPRLMTRAARFCFTEPERFAPSPIKAQVIVWAGRLSEQKRPLLFIDAVASLRARHPDLVQGWSFELYGQGVLAAEVSDHVTACGLTGTLTVGHAMDMAPIFARSRLYVSTQAVENFTSLSMLEAMAAGNAVVAEDVGQTREFVREGENGWLAPAGTSEAFADAIAAYLRHPERHSAMARASRAMTTEVHTIEHFAEDITAFWRDVVAAG